MSQQEYKSSFWCGSLHGRIVLSYSDRVKPPQFVTPKCFVQKYDVYIPYDVIVSSTLEPFVDLNLTATFQSQAKATLFIRSLVPVHILGGARQVQSGSNITFNIDSFFNHDPQERTIPKGSLIGTIELQTGTSE